MKESPKDKMVKTSPHKKEVKKPAPKKPEEEKDEETTEHSAADVKTIQVIEKSITQYRPDEIMNHITRPQIELMKRTVAKGATDDELKLFLNVCAGAKLNPFLKQVHYVKRWDSKEGREVGAIQVGIDGFRAIAEDGGQYAGSDDAIFRDESEVEFDMGKAGKKKSKVPGTATVTVYKLMEGTRYPFTATARWSEYYPGPKQGYMWHKMPFGQLGKCAEALALRKAFPKLLSGLYSPEEMDQAGGTNAPAEPNAYDKAKAMIAKVKDARGLLDYKAKVGGSTKYTDEQKKEIVDAVDARLKEIGYVEAGAGEIGS